MTPALSTLDRLALLQSRVDTALLKIGVRYPLRRRLCMGLCGRLAVHTRNQLATVFCAILGESREDAAALARLWIYYRLLARGTWLNAENTPTAAASQDMPPARVLDEKALGNYLSGAGGVVLASIHMGDYLQGLTALAEVLQGRRLVIVRRLDASAAEDAAFARFSRAGIRFEVLRHKQGAALAAVRKLRGGCVLVVLYDLSRRWGRTGRVRLFGREADLVRGPVELAAAAAADLLPVVTTFDAQGRLEVEAGAVIPAVTRTETHTALQCLASFAERRIRRDPAQWNHWTLLPEMLAGGDSADCAGTQHPRGSAVRG